MPWPKGRKFTAEHKAKVAEGMKTFCAANPEWRRARAEKLKVSWTERRRRDQATHLFETQARAPRRFREARLAGLADWLHSEENAAKLSVLRRSPGFEEKRATAHRAKYPPLPPMGPAERRLYKKLRRCGVARDAAIAATMQEAPR